MNNCERVNPINQSTPETVSNKHPELVRLSTRNESWQPVHKQITKIYVYSS